MSKKKKVDTVQNDQDLEHETEQTSSLVSVELKIIHTHKGSIHQPGDIIKVTRNQSNWLKQRKII